MTRVIRIIKKSFLGRKLICFFALPLYHLTHRVSLPISNRVPVDGVTVQYDQLTVVFPPSIGVDYSTSIYLNNVYGFEPFTWKCLKSLLAHQDLFIDIGANIGFYSVLCSLSYPQVKVLSFEPVPTIYKQALALFSANNVASTNLIQAALSHTEGVSEIYLPPSSSLSEERTATLRPDSWQRDGRHTTFHTKTTTLDIILHKFSLSDKILIKTDVEDFESAVLKGGINMLPKHRPIIVCEILPRAHCNHQTVSMLKILDYIAFAITPVGLFRFDWDSFQHRRSFTDFLLVHADLTERGLIPFSELSSAFTLA